MYIINKIASNVHIPTSFFIEMTISFEKENYTVIEDNGPVQVCINSTDLMGVIEVVISPIKKGVDNPAAGIYYIFIQRCIMQQ